MTTSNSGFALALLKMGSPVFSNLSAMVPITQDDAHRIVVGPLEKLATQTEKAAHIRKDSLNKDGFEALHKCKEDIASVLYGPKVDATQTPENEQDNEYDNGSSYIR